MSGKREYNRKIKSLAILKVAEEIFLEKPYGAITVDEIAKKANMTKRTLYSYFPSKLALFTKMFDDYLKRLNRGILEIIDERKNPEETLFSVFNYLFNFTKENEKFMRLFWTLDSEEFNGDLPTDLVHSIKMWNRSMIDQTVKIIKRGQHDGCISQFDPELLVHVMSAFNKGIFIHANKEAKLSIADVDTSQMNRMFWNLLKPGLFPTETT